MTFSTYKHRNIAKTMIGVTPRGIISYLSSSYGGSVSDRQIIERSSLVRNTSLFDRQDSILADRGVMVQDLFSSMNVLVNNPTSMADRVYVSLGTAGTYPGYGPVYRNVPW